jgi:hypothetical protein
LGVEVMAAARGRKLPDAVAESFADLASAHAALLAAASRRIPVSGAPDAERSRAADVALDATWSALYDVLSGWAKLPDHPQAERAAGLLPQIFPEGVRFVLFVYKLEWAESNTRLLLIKERRLEADLEALGCAPILRRLREAHKEYGDALGVTVPTAGVTEAISLRDALDDFSGALREYVVRVTASVRRRDPKTSELARVLLAPVQRWEAPPNAAPRVPPPAEAAAAAEVARPKA